MLSLDSSVPVLMGVRSPTPREHEALTTPRQPQLLCMRPPQASFGSNPSFILPSAQIHHHESPSVIRRSPSPIVPYFSHLCDSAPAVPTPRLICTTSPFKQQQSHYEVYSSNYIPVCHHRPYTDNSSSSNILSFRSNSPSFPSHPHYPTTDHNGAVLGGSVSLIDHVDSRTFSISKGRRRNRAFLRVAFNQHRMRVRQELESIDDSTSACVVSSRSLCCICSADVSCVFTGYSVLQHRNIEVVHAKI